SPPIKLNHCGEEKVIDLADGSVDEWEHVSEDYVQHEEEAVVLNRDVKVGDKIMITKIDGVEVNPAEFRTVTEIDLELALMVIDCPLNGNNVIEHSDWMYNDDWVLVDDATTSSKYDEEEALQHRQTLAYYDDEALSPSYSDAVKAGMTFAEYTGANITEESLDFEPKEEEVLRGITAESLNFEEAPKSDAVNHPSHYNRYSREVIESIKGLCTPEEFRGYLKGNIIKYSARYGGKDGLQDIDKLAKYTQFLKEFEIEMENE